MVTPFDKATVEHMDDESVKNPEKWNVTMCCGRCNSSHGNKDLIEWSKTDYCKERNINEQKVAPIIKEYIKKYYK